MFVCFGGMSNVDILSGLASLEALQKIPEEKAGIFCLGGLPTEAPTVLAKTEAVNKIITVDGCPLHCAKKIVEQAGFIPTHTLTLTEDCNIKKGSPESRSDSEMEIAVNAIINVIMEE